MKILSVCKNENDYHKSEFPWIWWPKSEAMMARTPDEIYNIALYSAADVIQWELPD